MSVTTPEERLHELVAEPREVVLAGGAGTGKTTLVRSLLSSQRRSVTLLAPTGQAANRLREVTGHAAATIHSALYKPPTEDQETLQWEETREVGDPEGIVVVDEASMVGLALADDLRAALAPRTTLLWVGDPYQLPPVDDVVGCDLQQPDIKLDRVWRSSSGIMEFAYAITRARTPPELSQLVQHAHKRFSGVHRLDGSGWTPAAWYATASGRGASVRLLTYTNELRHSLNLAAREALGHPGDTLALGKELMVCRSNSGVLGIVNGQQFRVVGLYEADPDLPHDLVQLNLEELVTGRRVQVYCSPDELMLDSRQFRERRREASDAWRVRIRGGQPFQNPKWRDQAQAWDKTGVHPPGRLFGPAAYTAHLQLGYALTCHSAQGSEADAVGLVWDAWYHMKRNFEDAKAWWYTAVTRAKTGVVLWLQ